MKINTNPVRGMKDFLPDEAELRERVKRTIIDTYTSFGYRKIETPILEHLNLLQSGDGGDNEKLTFKVMKRGEKLKIDTAKDENDLADSGLRFDLTVPLSRIYANNQGNIPLPFKVIQADWVFRAERPQKGRYRQFMQCDIDVIGEKDITAEIDLLIASSQALLNIGFEDFTIKINDRKVLHDLAAKWKFEEDKHDSVFVTLDKLDKVGVEGIKKELEEKEFAQDAINAMMSEIEVFKEMANEEIEQWKDVAKKERDQWKDIVDEEKAKWKDKVNSEREKYNNYMTQDLKKVIDALKAISNGKFKIEFDPTLVRGMGYYTGMIYEIKYKDYPGSVGGGGRYDKMIGKRIGQDVPACGFSIGFERIVDIMLEKEQANNDKKIAMIFNPESDDIKMIYSYADAYREKESCVISILKREKKFGKQLKKILDQGFTHYTTLENNEVFVTKELGKE